VGALALLGLLFFVFCRRANKTRGKRGVGIWERKQYRKPSLDHSPERNHNPAEPRIRITPSQHLLSFLVHSQMLLILTMEIPLHRRPNARPCNQPLRSFRRNTKKLWKANNKTKTSVSILILPTRHPHPLRRRSVHRALIRTRWHPQASDRLTTPTL
jgi:hypothetical protein